MPSVTQDFFALSYHEIFFQQFKQNIFLKANTSSASYLFTVASVDFVCLVSAWEESVKSAG